LDGAFLGRFDFLRFYWCFFKGAFLRRMLFDVCFFEIGYGLKVDLRIESKLMDCESRFMDCEIKFMDWWIG